MTKTTKARPDPAWGVETETHADHVVLRPPNRLKERATRVTSLRDPADNETIARAEHALDLLSPEFDAWMEIEVEALETARSAFAAKAGAGTLGEVYRTAHDLRGQSATFGFPLAGEIADGLCDLVERSALAPQALVTAVDRHVAAIRAIVREQVRDRDHPVGVELTAQLAALRARLAPRSAA